MLYTINFYRSNDEEEMFVDVHDFEPKEAVRFLKVQLTSLSGIACELSLSNFMNFCNILI